MKTLTLLLTLTVSAAGQETLPDALHIQSNGYYKFVIVDSDTVWRRDDTLIAKVKAFIEHLENTGEQK